MISMLNDSGGPSFPEDFAAFVLRMSVLGLYPKGVVLGPQVGIDVVEDRHGSMTLRPLEARS
jgi:hypothetical protein